MYYHGFTFAPSGTAIYSISKMKFNRKSISIASWNVNGLSGKINDDHFCSYIEDYDCVILNETWLDKESNGLSCWV